MIFDDPSKNICTSIKCIQFIMHLHSFMLERNATNAYKLVCMCKANEKARNASALRSICVVISLFDLKAMKAAR